VDIKTKINKLITETGSLGVLNIDGENFVRVVVEGAGSSNTIVVSARLVGQSDFTVLKEITGSANEKVKVVTYEEIKIECTVFEATSSFVKVIASSFNEASGSAIEIDVPAGDKITEIETLSLISSDSTVIISGNNSSKTIDLKVNLNLDDVLEYDSLANFPVIGESKTLYVARDTEKIYRYSGSIYVEVSPSQVTSVNSQTGDVILTKSDIGLSNVDNTSDINKPISTLTQLALDSKEDLSNKSDNSLLGTSSTLYPTQKAVKEYTDNSVSTLASLKQDNLISGTNIKTVNGESLLGSGDLVLAGGAVDSVNGQTGIVVLTKSDIGLSNVDNTSDLNKPISTATQLALDGKYDASNPAGYITLAEVPSAAVTSVNAKTGDVILNKSDIGLSNVDNTSDADKPISNATQLALDAKQDTLVSSTNIKTINGESLLGSGNLTISGGSVNSVNGEVGDVVLDKADLGLSNVDNTSDADKPISTATQLALDDKYDIPTGTPLQYLKGDGTLGDVIPKSRTLVSDVFNNTGSSIPKMTVVYINGGQGDMPTIALAQANSENSSSKTFAITAQAIANMTLGQAVVSGALTGLNTTVFGAVEGSTLYLSPTFPGGITAIKPSAPNHIVSVGKLVRVHLNEGVIEVAIQNGYELEELHDVAISSVQDDQFLKYEQSSQLWVNHTLTKSDVGLSNVDNTSDLDKPISTATQTALDGYVKIDGNTVELAIGTTTDNNVSISRNGDVRLNLQSSTSLISGPEVVLNSTSTISLNANTIFTKKQITFYAANSTDPIQLNGFDIFDYVGQGNPNQTSSVYINSGSVTDSYITTNTLNVPSGEISINSGSVNQGLGSSGNVIIRTGDSQNSTSGNILLETGLAPSSTKGNVVISANEIQVNNSRITSLSNPVASSDASTKQYVDNSIASIYSNVTISALNIDWTLGTTFYKSINTNSTFTFSNVVPGKTITVVIFNSSASGITVTFPSVRSQANAFELVIASNRANVYVFTSVNGFVYASSIAEVN